MADDRKNFPVSIYFVWQWWERHYQCCHGRPKAIDYDWLDRHYLGRQRFLFEKFGPFGIGAEKPVLDKNFVSKLLPFHTIVIPVLLGTQASIQEEGGYGWQNLPEERMRNIRPVAMADSPVGELIRREYRRLKARYGAVTQMIDLASATNNAFSMRGTEFYADLLVEKEFARQYLGVITETMCLAYKFITGLFGPMEGFPLGNCNVTMISPEIYEEMILACDIRCVEFAATVTGKAPCCDLHHCNVRTEPFAAVYGKIPGLRTLQGSCLSDIPAIKRTLPKVGFSAMLNPVDLLTKAPARVEQELERCLAAGAADFAIWDIDPAFDPERMKDLFGRIATVCRKQERQALFSVTPFSWEELDWEFPAYRTWGWYKIDT